jgi:hypothetical protein
MGQQSDAPVIIDGEEVTRVYDPVGSFSAQDCAPQIALRFVALAEKGFTGTMQARAIPSANATAVNEPPAFRLKDLSESAVTMPGPRLAAGGY